MSKTDWSDVKETKIYRCIYTNFLHQDKLSWDRTTALGVVELATLATGYSQRSNQYWGIAALYGGSIILVAIYALICRDHKIRDFLHINYLDEVHLPKEILLSPHISLYKTGRVIIAAVVSLLVLTNFVLASYSLVGASLIVAHISDLVVLFGGAVLAFNLLCALRGNPKKTKQYVDEKIRESRSAGTINYSI